MSSKKVVPPGSPYDALSYREVQAECKRRGLKAVAKKDELSRSLFVDDQSPRKKEIPKPSIPSVSSSSSSSLKTSYPPPTPPYSDSDDEDDEEEEEEEIEQEQQQEEVIIKKEKTPTTSPYKSPKKSTPAKRTTPATSPRYPTPLKSVISRTTESEVPRVPGWMLQLGAGLIFLLIAVLVYGARPVIENNQVPPTKTAIDSILRPVLSNYPAGDKILQTIKLHEGGKALSMFLVGPTDKGLQIVNDIAKVWPRYNISKHLFFENSNGTVIFEDIETALKEKPETIVVINTDKIDRENGKFLGVLLDDSIAGKDKLRVDKAVIILLGDLAKEDGEIDTNEHTVLQTLVKSRFIDRVAQRVRNVIRL